MLVYDFMNPACITGILTVVVHGFDDVNLGVDCNDSSQAYQTVFEARALPLILSRLVFPLFAWQLNNNRRPSFDFEQDVKHWAQHL
ncbi:uncharacterized protein M421DRAFT_397657 [Didymella exigua CBS 183.55]|uniref:Uncharacterized protein n=1 Tax=Didymella exigua CBS 183.55 TaxID=1150837 RepID=A0A6A5RCG4_9PLEO|nr:uncharacterized protein M421DRAFT_397657 [Didymella exigua CBS 183.55]KAF1925931.1 hypothetical protein M421DRAFT_397657 [Didymella exigua CBS 183.55]